MNMCSIRKTKDILLLALLLGFVVFMTERCTYDKLPEPISTIVCDTLDTCGVLNVCDTIFVNCDTVCDTLFFKCNTLTVCDTLDFTYLGDIKPIVQTSCLTSGTTNCHKSGGIGVGDFTTYAGLKEKVDNAITQTVKEMVDSKTMPIGGSLTNNEILKIDCWIDAGALNN